FDRQVNRIFSFEQWTTMGVAERSAFATRRLDELAPSWSATHLGSALVKAAEAFEEKRGSESDNFAIRQVIMLSHHQDGSRLETWQAAEWHKGIELRAEP